MKSLKLWKTKKKPKKPIRITRDFGGRRMLVGGGGSVRYADLISDVGLHSLTQRRAVVNLMNNLVNVRLG